MWKLSQFTVVKDLADRDLLTHSLIFSTRNRRCFVVGNADWQALTAGLDAPETLPLPMQATVRRLFRDGYIVPRERDERAYFAAEFDTLRYGHKALMPYVTVTTACNIGCTYCYEEGVQSQTMRTPVIDGIIRWMERRIVEDGVTHINPGLFGGEPLMYPNLLFEFMDKFNAMRARHGAEGEFSTSSNGVLLTDELAAGLRARGLVKAQISIDGPQTIHDQRRVGKKGQPSFAESLRGLRIAARHFPSVALKINFDRHNRGHAEEVFDLIVAEGLTDKISVKLETIAHQMPGSKVEHNPDYVIPPQSEELADAYLQMTLQCEARGIQVSRDTAHTTPCMFSSNHGVIFGPDGTIYKCISLVGRAEFGVGTVFDDEYDRVEYDKQMNTHKRLDECFSEACPYVPVCAGGCAYESVVRTGNYNTRFCTRPFLQKFHYLRYLIQHEDKLKALGMRPVTAQELAASEVEVQPPRPRLPVLQAAATSGCGTCG